MAQEKPGWDFDDEGVWQFGSFGSPGIEAWTLASEAKRVRRSLSSGRAPLLAPSPLRTGLEGFPSSGSSTQKRPLEKRGRSLIQNESGLLDTGLLPIRTAEGIPPAVCEAAPTACAVVICFASYIGSSRGLELEHQ
jgi:hypothetical protein